MLVRLNNPSTDSRLYTTSYDETMNAFLNLSYVPEDSPGQVATTLPIRCICSLKPVYRVDKPAPTEDHLYTMNEEEADTAVSTQGYINKVISFYCASVLGADCGASLALHRYKTSNPQQSHFYTTDLNEGKNVTSLGGKDEGILCYIWPN